MIVSKEMMTAITSGENTTALVSQNEQLIFHNRSDIVSRKWHFSEEDEKTISARVNWGGFLILLAVVWWLGSKQLDVAAVLTFVFGALLETFTLPRLGWKLIERRKRKQQAYRWEHLFTILDGISLAHWEIVAENFMEAKTTLANTDVLFLLSPTGVRYQCQQINFEEEEIKLLLTLNDKEVEERNAEIEDNEQIALHIKQHEEVKGAVMSPEFREGFVAGWKTKPQSTPAPIED